MRRSTPFDIRRKTRLTPQSMRRHVDRSLRSKRSGDILHRTQVISAYVG
jgi:hypothetical protein